ncbi:MAG: CpaF family protein [Anaerolineae bacterium]|nr:CpaF family protein [Anaerolineae bacterium]
MSDDQNPPFRSYLERGQELEQMRIRIGERIRSRLSLKQSEITEEMLAEQFDLIAQEEGTVYSHAERKRFLAMLATDLLPAGPLLPYLADPAVAEIMVNGYDLMFVEKQGVLHEIESPFRDNAHLTEVIQAIFAQRGRTIDAKTPIGDSRLPDGSRVNAVLPPVAITGPTLTIRKFAGVSRQLQLEDVIHYGSLSEDMATFVRACIEARLNIAVSGGTGSGKTTLLRIFAEMIPDGERIVVVENATELHLSHKHVVRMESRPPDANGEGEVTIRDLVINAARMRPDRIIVGELRAAETLELIQLMKTGHDGTLFSLHADGPRDALARLEMMATMSDFSLPLLTIRQMIASSIHVITHQERLHDGTRRLVKIAEVVGMQGDTIALNDLFEFRQTGTKDGQIEGFFTATGQVPRFLGRFRDMGIDVPMTLFQPR